MNMKTYLAEAAARPAKRTETKQCTQSSRATHVYGLTGVVEWLLSEACSNETAACHDGGGVACVTVKSGQMEMKRRLMLRKYVQM